MRQSRFALASATSFPRKRGGSLRSGVHSAIIAVLFVSGLWLWVDPGSSLVLWLHVMGGIALTATLAPWLWRHVLEGLAKSERHGFTQFSWALLAVWIVLLTSGLAMVVPVAWWLAGRVWFPQSEVSQAMSFVHFWSSWLAAVGLGLHLAMRHWKNPRP
ncbi:hypothetical protein [Hoeflea sp.]|uniref:hypothetical protein n=1 Tax=Hoeflea sp. TaxID=1940281 RepID=UPI0019AA5058|nr:hypothetical protein [Hoeflea sp.]MBC7281615.1 hypothetical protein [Hoeflea sp.]